MTNKTLHSLVDKVSDSDRELVYNFLIRLVDDDSDLETPEAVSEFDKIVIEMQNGEYSILNV